MFRQHFIGCLLAAGIVAGNGAVAGAEPPAPGTVTLKPCRLTGVEHDASCGVLQRPLDPARPDGPRIDLHFAVIPALARNKHPDPVFFFAGGPGQSAMELAGSVSRLLARLANRRDLVFIDQRGTGRSAPLVCEPPPPTTPLGAMTDPRWIEARLVACIAQLKTLPHGDLRFYTTTIAMQDAEAVRRALGAARINLVGASYGTRAALEYQRQFPQVLRRVVIDGVAPPDMVLPAAFSVDNEAALQSLLTWCASDTACAARHPELSKKLQSLLAALPRRVTLIHPATLVPEEVSVDRELVLSMIRTALYRPLVASALPLAVEQAAGGRFDALLALGTTLIPTRRGQAPAEGMHFAVVCAEDLPRLERAAADGAPGATFGNAFADYYRRVCAGVPRGSVPEAFYQLPQASGATLVSSGGVDPATPARHGERAAKALGPKARHVLVPNAGHGVLGIGCMRDVVFRFIDAVDDEAALQVDASCVQKIPRPPAFALPAGGAR